MATYDELVGDLTKTPKEQGLVRDWMNRTDDVLGETVIERCLQWGADKAYRELRIPPLEFTQTYTLEDTDELQIEGNSRNAAFQIPVPSDYSELISLRRTGAGDNNNSSNKFDVVLNTRVDVRTFFDPYSEKPSGVYYTRRGNLFYISGRFSTGDEIEVHYYRRLPSLNAKYGVIPANFNGLYLEYVTDSLGDPVEPETDFTKTLFFRSTVADAAIRDIASGTTAYTTSEAAGDDFKEASFTGLEAPNWLRDENEKILIYGACVEAAIYLGEPEEIQKFKQLFDMELDALNMEEKKRDASGGNAQISYSSLLL